LGFLRPRSRFRGTFGLNNNVTISALVVINLLGQHWFLESNQNLNCHANFIDAFEDRHELGIDHRASGSRATRQLIAL